MLPHNVLAIRLQFNPIAFGSQYLVMRLLYADENPDGSGDLQALGFGEYEENLFYRLRAVPTGLSVIAGPTGSGKSTTLQRNMIKLLQEKNYEINLITVEDPPEYPIPGAPADAGYQCQYRRRKGRNVYQSIVGGTAFRPGRYDGGRNPCFGYGRINF